MQKKSANENYVIPIRGKRGGMAADKGSILGPIILLLQMPTEYCLDTHSAGCYRRHYTMCAPE